MSPSSETFVFAYASLLELGAQGSRQIVRAEGLRRTWNVAMDNMVSMPGYKYYVDPASGDRPAVHVVFLNLAEHASGWVNGVLLPASDFTLRQLDARERNYERVEIGERIAERALGPVWTYRGTAAARERFLTGRRQGDAVVDENYLTAVQSHFRALGPRAHRDFLASTDCPACPVRALQRIQL